MGGSDSDCGALLLDYHCVDIAGDSLAFGDLDGLEGGWRACMLASGAWETPYVVGRWLRADV